MTDYLSRDETSLINLKKLGHFSIRKHALLKILEHKQTTNIKLSIKSKNYTYLVIMVGFRWHNVIQMQSIKYKKGNVFAPQKDQWH